ncbi:MAG: cytochrome P450 [Acidobacteriota bacterium]
MMFLDSPIPPRDYVENPHAHFARWRALSPLHYAPARDLWLVLSYDSVAQLLRDERLELTNSSSFLERSQAFRSTVVRELRIFFSRLDDIEIDKVLCATVDRALQRVLDAGYADLVTEIAQFIPLAVMGHLLGVPDPELRILQPLSVASIIEYDFSSRSASLSLGKRFLDAYFLRHLARAQTAESTPLMRMLVQAQKEHDIAAPVLADVCSRLLTAGTSTTSGVLANILVRLLQMTPAVVAELASEGRLPMLTEELLRLDSSILGIKRLARCDFDLPGARIKKGQKILLMTAAANRDPSYLPHPDSIDLAQAGKRHLTFGQGEFHCLGAILARKEIMAVIRSVVPYLSRLRLQEAPERRTGWLVYEPVTVRVKTEGECHAH